MIRNIVAFPGLGIELFLKETAFVVFGLNVQWYGIILTAGIIFAFLLFYRLAVKVEKIPEDHILNLTLITIPIAIVGARLTYVLTSGYEYKTFWDIINIRSGGIAVYGSIIFGALTMLVYCRVKKLPFLKIVDAAALAEMVGQIIGRWGNFVNGEAYGKSANIAKLPWRMTIQEQKLIDSKWVNISAPVVAHPTFLYESLWNLIGLIIISRFYKRKKRDGQILLMYLAWYGLGRGLIEILRTDSLTVFGQKLFVYLGLGSFLVCSALLAVMFVKTDRKEKELSEYRAAYGESETVLNPQDENQPEPTQNNEDGLPEQETQSENGEDE